ncbi:site-specific integrase [Polaromonas sp.]|uniref:site-specific integrase n=1 Tax=Polaromonas sp. TaxID=1869339 RepID=UPI003BA9A323
MKFYNSEAGAELAVLENVPLLKPGELSSLMADAVKQLLREGESAHTVASYRTALRYWAGWFALRYGSALTLPLPASAAQQFIVDHIQRQTGSGLHHELPDPIDQALVTAGLKGKIGPMALGTLVHRLAVLSKLHQDHKLFNPCADPQVRHLLAMTRRAHAKRGALPQRKDALVATGLRSALDTCGVDLKGLRDRALLLFAWSTGGRRRSEVAGADMRWLKPIGPLEYSYQMGVSKTNQDATARNENFKPVVGTAAAALEAWLKAAVITEGPLFRRIGKGGRIGAALSPAAVRDIVKARCGAAGLVGDFSAHSLRSGFVTEAVRQDVPLAETMAMTGHRSVQSLIGYARGSGGKHTALRLLGESTSD